METEWHTLGKVQYQKWSLYAMDWASQNVVDLRDYLVACAPYGGPIALLRDVKKQLKVASPETSLSSRELLLFNACGQQLGAVTWAPFDTKRETLVDMTWTDELRLLCVFTSGSCVTFSLTGDEETRFTLLPPASVDQIATFEAWGSGLVALTEKMALVQVLDVDSRRTLRLAWPYWSLNSSRAFIRMFY
uniref:Vps16 N-terminal domain-containing protein n=1 Tax=Hyaloperonospora arabidopsidis (strain Emoy2) TaxID=559515 RepID=M4BQT1_HYAAE